MFDTYLLKPIKRIISIKTAKKIEAVYLISNEIYWYLSSKV